MLNEQDKIKELFSEKLGNFEAPVNPALWKGVASQIGSTTTVAASGVTLLTKVIIGAVATTVIGVASYFVFKDNSVDNAFKRVVKLSEQSKTLGSTTPNEKNELASDVKVLMTHCFDKNDDHLDQDNAKYMQNQAKLVSSEDITAILDVADEIPTEENSTSVKAQPVVPEKIKEIKEKTPVEYRKNQNRNKPNEIIQSNNSDKEETKLAIVKTASLDKVPNVFSPDGDRINDELFIEFTGELNDFSVIVLDKNNKTIYSSQDPNFSWNGIMMNGELAPKGDYMYVITARDSNGNKINKYSTLAIR